jgi:hypothetical protein
MSRADLRIVLAGSGFKQNEAFLRMFTGVRCLRLAKLPSFRNREHEHELHDRVKNRSKKRSGHYGGLSAKKAGEYQRLHG